MTAVSLQVDDTGRIVDQILTFSDQSKLSIHRRHMNNDVVLTFKVPGINRTSWIFNSTSALQLSQAAYQLHRILANPEAGQVELPDNGTGFTSTTMNDHEEF